MTTVTWLLQEVQDGTRLMLQHEGEAVQMNYVNLVGLVGKSGRLR